jgi:hypothetical protein
MDQDEAVFRPRYAGDVLHIDRDLLRSDEVVAMDVHDIKSCINHQSDRQGSGPGDDELVCGPQFSRRKPEAHSHINDRDDSAADIQNTEDNFRRFGEGGYCRCPDDTFNGPEREGILLLI